MLKVVVVDDILVRSAKNFRQLIDYLIILWVTVYSNIFDMC